MTRRLLAMVTMSLIALVVPSATANAAPTTTTTHVHGVVETFVDVFPTCEENPPLYEITTTRNGVAHETLFADGRMHGTFTDTGTFAAEPLDSSLPSYTGKFTIWGGFNANKRSVNGTFTFNVHGTGSDGSTFRNHVTEHFNERPNGMVQEFFKCH
jgi:hypothetical protein